MHRALVMSFYDEESNNIMHYRFGANATVNDICEVLIEDENVFDNPNIKVLGYAYVQDENKKKLVKTANRIFNDHKDRL